MKAKVLHAWSREVYDPSPRPTCQHDVQVVGDHAREYRKEAHAKGIRGHRRTARPNQCTFPAVVELDGVPLCRRHAGQIALDYLLKTAEKQG